MFIGLWNKEATSQQSSASVCKVIENHVKRPGSLTFL